MSKFQFGDVLLNHWASEKNPQRIGIFVRELKNTYLLTDGKGKFWESMKKDAKLEKLAAKPLGFNCGSAAGGESPAHSGPKGTTNL
jgi:hypothetical protein